MTLTDDAALVAENLGGVALEANGSERKNHQNLRVLRAFAGRDRCRGFASESLGNWLAVAAFAETATILLSSWRCASTCRRAAA